MTTRKDTVCTTLSEVDKKELDKLADEWGLRPGVILRRLILFLLQGRMSFEEILKASYRNSEPEPFDFKEKLQDYQAVRAALDKKEKKQLLAIAKTWDFTISAILRRLVKALVNGAIPKKNLW